ncbi:hypothetical protein [Halomonas sp. 707B3]|uniref:hypothetical protein n=1 Tax=Halomonas sp. 707B3 TaxID=1681043 RepID=UPI0020A009F1|nr:hypothetical protein [Halomonas sp. 707B3]MCP1316885.1 hypothetical protein [Halomonas sp. 707B3]
MTTLTITQDAQKRYLKSVLSNLTEYGFNYRSVYHTEAIHGLTIDRAIEVAFANNAVHIGVTHTGNRGRKIGLLLNIEDGVPPADLISDVGAAHKNDIAIAERCIAGGTAA